MPADTPETSFSSATAAEHRCRDRVSQPWPFFGNLVLHLVPPHKWVGGYTFEYEFDLEMPVNPHYQAEPTPKAKPVKSRKALPTLEPAPSATKPSKAGKTKKPKRARLTPEELKERRRQRAVKNARTEKNAASASTAPTVLSKDKPGAPIASKCVAIRVATTKSTDDQRPRSSLRPQHIARARGCA